MKGLGKAICVQLARQGFDVFFTFWRPYDRSMPWGVEDHEPDSIKKEIKELGVDCEYLEADLMDTASIDDIFSMAAKRPGVPSVLVNNATYSTMTCLDNISAGELDRHYQVNLRAVVLMCQKFVAGFKGESPGRIINISSGQSLSAMSQEIAYAITKGAIETFTRSMQHELARKNITINAINPGLTDTGWTESGWMSREQLDIFRKRFPGGRLGLPTDAAKLAGFLASEDAGWITGQIIHAEGGFMRENYDV